MHVKTTHRGGGKPYAVKRTYNHGMKKGTKVPQHATHSSGSKRHK